MSWNQSVVTNAGVGLLNESLAGHTLTIESAVGGAGTLTEEELAAATDVVDQKQTFALLGIEDSEGGKKVGIQITNKGVSESYILHQIGVKARLEYEGAPLTLLIILQDEHGVEIPTEEENPDWLFEIYAVISISNKANITVNIDTSAIASVSYVQRTFVPMTRKINGKVLSGDVTLSGDDIKTSAEDNTPVSAALSNKVSVPQSILPGTDLNTVTAPGMYYYDGETLPNMPGADNAFSLLVETIGSYGAQGRKQTYTPWHQNVTYTRIFSGDTAAPWSQWVQLAAAASLWMYDLPLAEGFSGYAKYSIDPFDRVLIMLQGIQKTDASVLGNGVTEMIGTIPVGYRPAAGINTTAIATDTVGSPIYGIYQLWVDPDGGVRCYAQSGVQATMLRGFLVFQAQN